MTRQQIIDKWRWIRDSFTQRINLYTSCNNIVKALAETKTPQAALKRLKREIQQCSIHCTYDTEQALEILERDMNR